jgi:hypothetical protein
MAPKFSPFRPILPETAIDGGMFMKRITFVRTLWLFLLGMAVCGAVAAESKAPGSFSLYIEGKDNADKVSTADYLVELGDDGLVQRIGYTLTREGGGEASGVMIIRRERNTLSWGHEKDIDGYIRKYELTTGNDGFVLVSRFKNVDRPQEGEIVNIYLVRYILRDNYLWESKRYVLGGLRNDLEFRGERSQIIGEEYIEKDMPMAADSDNRKLYINLKYVYKDAQLGQYNVLDEQGSPGWEYKGIYAFSGNDARITALYENWKYLYDSSERDDWHPTYTFIKTTMIAKNIFNTDMKTNILNHFIITVSLGNPSPYWIPFLYGLAPASQNEK